MGVWDNRWLWLPSILDIAAIGLVSANILFPEKWKPWQARLQNFVGRFLFVIALTLVLAWLFYLMLAGLITDLQLGHLATDTLVDSYVLASLGILLGAGAAQLWFRRAARFALAGSAITGVVALFLVVTPGRAIDSLLLGLAISAPASGVALEVMPRVLGRLAVQKYALAWLGVILAILARTVEIARL